MPRPTPRPPIPLLLCACGARLSLGFPLPTRSLTNLTACASCEAVYFLGFNPDYDPEDEQSAEYIPTSIFDAPPKTLDEMKTVTLVLRQVRAQQGKPS